MLDAIRLLKSSYGGYAADEHMQWFGEFAINPQDRTAIRRIFRDPSSPVEISATIRFSESEREFLVAQAADLLWPIAWQRVTGQRIDHWTFSRVAISTQLAFHQAAIDATIATLRDELVAQLDREIQHQLSVRIEPDGSLRTASCPAAEASFQAYEPLNLGVIEFHSASRAYPRQPVAGINLDSRSFEDQRRQQTLYNWQAKYQNVKTELASGYLRNLIAAQAGQDLQGEDLNETLKELFKTFFPDKEYDGVRPLPGGNLDSLSDSQAERRTILTS